MKYKVSELDCARLDEAVALANGWQLKNFHGLCMWADESSIRFSPANAYRPSDKWEHGGPIIQLEGIGLGKSPNQDLLPGWSAIILPGSKDEIQMDGRTPLAAAMRCYVQAKLGEFVELTTSPYGI